MYEVEISKSDSFAEAPPNFKDLRARVDAAMKALDFAGPSEILVDETSQAKARMAFDTHAVNSDLVTDPASIVHLRLMLTEYDREVVMNAASLRNYVTNKLLEETGSADARIRIKALELLGKISDVGLFTEKTEVTFRHRPTEELERILREKLAKVIDMGSVPTVPEKTYAVEDNPDSDPA